MIITIDVSSTNIGWAIGETFNCDNNSQLINSGFIKLKRHKKYQFDNRLVDVMFGLNNVFKQLNLDKPLTVIFESPKVAYRGAYGFGKQKEFLGICELALLNNLGDNYNYELLNLIQIQAIQWQRFYSKKTKDKTWSVKSASELSNHNILDDNESDAINMYYVADKIILNTNKK